MIEATKTFFASQRLRIRAKQTACVMPWQKDAIPVIVPMVGGASPRPPDSIGDASRRGQTAYSEESL